MIRTLPELQLAVGASGAATPQLCGAVELTRKVSEWQVTGSDLFHYLGPLLAYHVTVCNLLFIFINPIVHKIFKYY